MSQEPLTPDQFRNATYLDFEGEGATQDHVNKKPHLAGLFSPSEKGNSGRYECVFFKEAWKPVSNGINQANHVDFDSFFDDLANRLKEADAYLVFWSIHESDVLKEFLATDIYTKLEPRFYNLLPLARRYINRREILGEEDSVRGKSLEDYFELIYPNRSPFAPFPLGAAEACRRIDKACEAHRRWRQFSEKQKSNVRGLVKYNEGDCRSTWLIAKRIGNYFSSQ